MADLPIGAIIYFGGVGSYDDFIRKEGDVSRTTYAALFRVVGTLFGDGDGSTTFGLGDASSFPGSDTSHGYAYIKYQ
jgi:microcystin-dependent protein